MMLPLCFILIYQVKYPSAYEHDVLFDILGVIQFHMICVCVCVCVCVLLCWVCTLKHMIDGMLCVEKEYLEHMSTYICVEREALEDMIFETFLLSMKF